MAILTRFLSEKVTSQTLPPPTRSCSQLGACGRGVVKMAQRFSEPRVASKRQVKNKSATRPIVVGRSWGKSSFTNQGSPNATSFRRTRRKRRERENGVASTFPMEVAYHCKVIVTLRSCLEPSARLSWLNFAWCSRIFPSSACPSA